MRRLWSKLIINLFWSESFKQVRAKHYNMAYEQGRFDEKAEAIYGIIDYKSMEEFYEN
ncbi:hypothetical protein [Paenibacillus sp. FSL H3-0333]|uniref:hypothetical protein n=1 Tax=Paenibacillus sp. FSL H3-0333 TaxID=2921373 RepID=UPI0030F4BB43